ncbi:hypothetical protein [Holzapfeliella sp. JNUCC 72]
MIIIIKLLVIFESKKGKKKSAITLFTALIASSAVAFGNTTVKAGSNDSPHTNSVTDEANVRSFLSDRALNLTVDSIDFSNSNSWSGQSQKLTDSFTVKSQNYNSNAASNGWGSSVKNKTNFDNSGITVTITDKTITNSPVNVLTKKSGDPDINQTDTLTAALSFNDSYFTKTNQSGKEYNSTLSWSLKTTPTSQSN